MDNLSGDASRRLTRSKTREKQEKEIQEASYDSGSSKGTRKRAPIALSSEAIHEQSERREEAKRILESGGSIRDPKDIMSVITRTASQVMSPKDHGQSLEQGSTTIDSPSVPFNLGNIRDLPFPPAPLVESPVQERNLLDGDALAKVLSEAGYKTMLDKQGGLYDIDASYIDSTVIDEVMDELNQRVAETPDDHNLTEAKKEVKKFAEKFQNYSDIISDNRDNPRARLYAALGEEKSDKLLPDAWDDLVKAAHKNATLRLYVERMYEDAKAGEESEGSE